MGRADCHCSKRGGKSPSLCPCRSRDGARAGGRRPFWSTALEHGSRARLGADQARVAAAVGLGAAGLPRTRTSDREQLRERMRKNRAFRRGQRLAPGRGSVYCWTVGLLRVSSSAVGGCRREWHILQRPLLSCGARPGHARPPLYLRRLSRGTSCNNPLLPVPFWSLGLPRSPGARSRAPRARPLPCCSWPRPSWRRSDAVRNRRPTIR